jgi:hypothetical protein
VAPRLPGMIRNVTLVVDSLPPWKMITVTVHGSLKHRSAKLRSNSLSVVFSPSSWVKVSDSQKVSPLILRFEARRRRDTPLLARVGTDLTVRDNPRCKMFSTPYYRSPSPESYSYGYPRSSAAPASSFT